MKSFIARNRFGLTIGCLLLLAGSLMAYQPVMRWYASRHVSRSAFSDMVLAGGVPAAPNRAAERVEGSPLRIEVPSVGIDLTVINGEYNIQDKTWTLTKDKAQFATMTPRPNNIDGNSFIYAHNRRGVFATLKNIRPGDKAYVSADNGKKFVYTFRVSMETNPYDDTLFYYQGPPILTLQTCSGIWYQNRQLFTFDLTEIVDNA